MTILAIDPGTNLGWATRLQGKLHFGVQEFRLARDESPGMRWLRLDKWLQEMQQLTGGIGLIVHERPHHRGGAATAILEGIVAGLQRFASEVGAEITAVPSGTLKRHATGKGNADKRSMTETAFKRFVTNGIPLDDNEADALWILDYSERKLVKN